MTNFKKIYLVFAIFFSFFISNSYAEIVKKIEARGNDRISLETILIFADIERGSNYELSDINLIIKKLYETNFFSKITVELKNGILLINVKENPIINKVEFKGETAKKYIEKIKELLVLGEKNSFIENYIKKDISVIKLFYRNLGYYFITIEAEVEQLSKNRVNLIYNLEKGDRAKISKIYFIGEKKIREKRLRDVITSQEAKFWKFISRNIYLNKGRIELDKRLLKNYYKNKGYYDVEVTSSNVEYSEGKGFILTYNINAGTRYRFKKISANVSDALDKSAFSSLEKEFDKVVGEYYSQRKLTTILEKVDRLSEQKELQFINHNVTETLDKDTIEVSINIFEGPKFIIERINITGNSVTNDSVIRSELLVDEGEPFSTLLANKSVNKLKARGIFGEVKQKITDGTSDNYKVIEINVTEQATGEITAGAGIGTDGTMFMLSVSENNWLGKGINLATSLEITDESISGALAIKEPNYKYSGNAVFGSLNISSTDKSSSSGYESSQTGFALGTEFEQYEDIYFSPALTATYEDIVVQSTASSNMKKMEGSFTNLNFDYGITFDKRNQPFQPTSGYRSKFIQSLPLITDSSSLMNGLDVSTYHGISDNVIGSIKFLGRTIHGLNDEDVRLTKRLYIPRKRLRGFNVRRVGPKEGENYVGGNYMTALGAEAQLPNLIPETFAKADVSVFFDVANVWGVDYSDTLDDSNKFRSSIGVAANVYTAIGPLSFVFANDLTKGTNDETQAFSFNLGTSF